jgi:hypothetical protein
LRGTWPGAVGAQGAPAIGADSDGFGLVGGALHGRKLRHEPIKGKSERIVTRNLCQGFANNGLEKNPGLHDNDLTL